MKQHYDVAAGILLFASYMFDVCSIHASDVTNINFYVANMYLQCCNGASDEKFPIGRMGASGAD